MNAVTIAIILLFVLYGTAAFLAPALIWFRSISIINAIQRRIGGRATEYPAYDEIARLYREDRPAFAACHRKDLLHMRVSGVGLTLFGLAALWFLYG